MSKSDNMSPQAGKWLGNDDRIYDIGGLDVTFHDAATEAADGAVFTVGGYKTLTVEIYGTSSSRTVEFYCIGPSGTPRPIVGYKEGDIDYPDAVSTTGTGEIWEFEITGKTSVMMKLTAVSGGNVTVKGRAVA